MPSVLGERAGPVVEKVDTEIGAPSLCGKLTESAARVKLRPMRTVGCLTWMRWVVVSGAGVLAACSGGGSSAPRDGGPDATLPGDGPRAADVPVGIDLAPDLMVDAMPDLKPDLKPDTGIPCGDGGECSASLSCCASFCVDTRKDPNHCAACGTACGSKRFCSGTACREVVFSSICDNPSAVVIKDPFDLDNMAAARIGAALMAACMPAPAVVEKDQGAPDVLDPEGRPLAGGSTSYLTGGGAFGQRLIEYLDKAALTPLWITGDGTNITFRNRMTGQDVVTAPRTTLNDGHDYFLVEVVVEPESGTLVIAVMGLLAPGTAAAGFWVSTEMVPKYTTLTDAWYVFEWTDSGDQIPNAADTFRLIAQGR